MDTVFFNLHSPALVIAHIQIVKAKNIVEGEKYKK
jgi:hypothetical protein